MCFNPKHLQRCLACVAEQFATFVTRVTLFMTCFFSKIAEFGFEVIRFGFDVINF
jgi:hypothetical protein